VRLSLDLVDLAKEPEVMRSADISLVLYQNETQNDCLTGFSSEKLALSLQCGVPIIAFNYPSYEHIRDEGCGILVDDLSEIPRAASKILADYTNYSSRAYRAFEKYYRFEANFQKVLAAVNELN
jgi:glycosyltransferase involved in cell wall biosynthesis